MLKDTGEMKHLLDWHPEQLVSRWQPYLQMLETSGLGQIWGMTKKGSAALVFMSWSEDTK